MVEVVRNSFLERKKRKKEKKNPFDKFRGRESESLIELVACAEIQESTGTRCFRRKIIKLM